MSELRQTRPSPRRRHPRTAESPRWCTTRSKSSWTTSRPSCRSNRRRPDGARPCGSRHLRTIRVREPPAEALAAGCLDDHRRRRRRHRTCGGRSRPREDVALALLPSGTGNLLARNLKLTLDDLEHSIHSAFTGEDRQIDLGMIEIRRADSRIDRHSYVVMAGLGLDAKMLANTDEELKAKIGWLAYVKAIAIALRDKNQLRLRYTLDDGGVRSLRAHTVIVGNCGSLQGNVMLMPDAAVDDGRSTSCCCGPRRSSTGCRSSPRSCGRTACSAGRVWAPNSHERGERPQLHQGRTIHPEAESSREDRARRR